MTRKTQRPGPFEYVLERKGRSTGAEKALSLIYL